MKESTTSNRNFEIFFQHLFQVFSSLNWKIKSFLKDNSAAYCKINAIPKRRDVVWRRQARRTCSLHRATFCTLLLNKCNVFAKRLLNTFGWSFGATFSVFPVSSKLPLDRQKVLQLARHLHTNTACLICCEGYGFFMNIDKKFEPIAEKNVKDFGGEQRLHAF